MNSFGRKFRVSLFGESHGEMIGVVMDGVPAGLPLTGTDFEADLDRRRAGALGTTLRKEKDEPRIVSGILEGMTTGAPLTVIFQNEDTRSGDYKNLAAQPRPGHADFVAREKWGGYNDLRGGGHFSGRLTLGLVAAGVVAKKILERDYGIEIRAYITEIGGIQRDSNSGGEGYEGVIRAAMEELDSVGGIVECTVDRVPVGWGEPFFDSVEGLLAHGLFAIPAVKGVEFGAGFAAAKMRGSEHNDRILDGDGKTATNYAGGINGGITNGNPVVFRVAVKPTSSIGKEQETYHFETGKVEPLVVKGRHDACITQRVPVVVEAVTAMVLCDLGMLFHCEL